MSAHPLSLDEIVLAIGRFIPLWEFSAHSADEGFWLFKPKDLLAAISVNRLFHATLTPLLWSVYVNFPFKSISDPKLLLCDDFHHIPFDIVEKNSPYIRFLDLSSYLPRFGRKVEQLELNCSRLQELHLNAFVDCAWAKRLILANPELRVLYWARASKKLTPEECLDFRSVLSLRRLRYLGLHDWNLLTQNLYCALAKNAGHLEELRLTNCNSIVTKRSKRDDAGKSHLTFVRPGETRIEEFEPMKKMCWSIRLAKVKTLHLDVEHFLYPLTLYWLVSVVPALETIVFGELLGSTAKELSLTLRKSCPRLRTIKQGNIWKENTWRSSQCGDTALHLVSACAPGHLVHASLDGWQIGNMFIEALSVHRDSLETLELAIRDDDYRDSFKNLGTILERCSRLKHLAVYFHRKPCERRQPLLFLGKLATCPGLESLAFHGFRLAYENNNRELGDCQPEACTFYGPGWRGLYPRNDSDSWRGECCDHFMRLVSDAVSSLSSLKRIVFGYVSYVKVLSSSS